MRDGWKYIAKALVEKMGGTASIKKEDLFRGGTIQTENLGDSLLFTVIPQKDSHCLICGRLVEFETECCDICRERCQR